MNGGGPPVGLLVAGAIVLVAAVWVIATYNGLVALRNHLKESWADIDVQLRRRYDLVPNLVATVKGYAAHEREIFERIAEERSRCLAHRGPLASQGSEERRFVSTLRQVLAIVERYPDLKADRAFADLQRELVDTEDRIAAARRFFNANVRDLNTRVEAFPSSLVGSIFGFDRAEYWEVEEATVREAPAVAV